MTLSTYLDRLEAMGLVARIPDPCDRRAKNVVVTSRADPLLLNIRAELRDMMDQVTSGLDADAREALRASLKSLRESLQQLDRCGSADKKGVAE
jgi:DNA-binding MarR family transcriptional regulator